MQPESVIRQPSAIEDALQQLKAIRDGLDPGADKEIAGSWHQALSESEAFLASVSHQIVFIGEVGVGKSSLVAVAAQLLLGDEAPKDKSSLKAQSLLAIGAGRTTVCEVRVRASKPGVDDGELGIELEAYDNDEMEKLMELWAEDEWRRRQPGVRTSDDAPTPQEVARALQSMTGFAEYTDIHSRRRVKPLDEIVVAYHSPEALAKYLLERANLQGRTRSRWWWPTKSASSLSELKAVAEKINLGQESTAVLPRRLTLVVPDPLPGVASDLRLDLSVVDTRGLEAGVGLFGRADLQEFVADPRTVLVLCAPFKAAPGEAIRNFLVALNGDARWQSALPRTLIVLLDHGDAAQVNGANEDPSVGHEIKISECLNSLGDAGLIDIGLGQVVAIDVLSDSPSRLQDALSNSLRAMRQRVETERNQRFNDASEFLRQRGDSPRARLQADVDAEIKRELSKHLAEGFPMRDALAGLYKAIEDTRYASVVYASCRRKGNYSGLNLYQAVVAEASRAMTAWLTAPVMAVLSRLESLKNDSAYTPVTDFLRLRGRQFETGYVKAVVAYAAAVESEVRQPLWADSALWQSCCDEWGQGGGFKRHVLAHFEEWSKRQVLASHQQLRPVHEYIPFWPEVVRPVRPPQFTLQVRQLRALRSLSWAPAPVSLLVGANGAGKTTTLIVLRLLKLAFERGLPEAVRIVLGGSSNLRSWGGSDEEPIVLGLDVGSAQWRISLNPREGSVDATAEERLTESDANVFDRDAFGMVRHQGQAVKMDDGPIALRALVDRGAIDPPVLLMAGFLQKIAVFQEPDLASLRTQGSKASDDQHLRMRGENVLAVLRRWHQDRSQHYRYQFVVGGLASAFPHRFQALDFLQAGNTLYARIYRPNSDEPSLLSDEANGLMQMLVLLCCVASADDGGLVAIDEPENGLHPYALRTFLRKARQWAVGHHVTILLATHSTVLLDEFSHQPEAVFVMRSPEDSDEPLPTALDQLCNREWLAGFKLGDLYEQGEIGSNDDGV